MADLSWKEIIISLILILYSVPSPEQVLGETILGISNSLPFYSGIHLLVFILPLLGFIGLVDGIARKFDSNIVEVVTSLKKFLEVAMDYFQRRI